MSKKRRRKEREQAEKKSRACGPSGRDYTPLGQHERKGSRLTPPLMTIPGGMNLSSWMNDRLPEMLWGALIWERLGRENALAAFRMVAQHVHDAGDDGVGADATLSAIARLPVALRQRVLSELCQPESARVALRPLLLFPELPGRETWANFIRQDPVPGVDWGQLARAVALVTDHQSEAATDLRWARVITIVATGTVHLPAGMRDTGDEILQYPQLGDMRGVRRTIRSMEGAFHQLRAAGGEVESAWSKQFWDRCLRETPCQPIPLIGRASAGSPPVGTTVLSVRAAADALAAHERATRSTTSVDPRHEATFGLAAYSLATLEELVRLGNGTGILGRAGLRAALETFLTLAYLVQKDDPATWRTYRSYGTGQAKLAFLKLDELTEMSPDDLPTSVDVQLLEALTNEDRWQEFIEINLGHWDASNLRATSEAGNEKRTYDRFYGWTSSFVHGNWAAVRVSVFDICANPLHRYHRVLRSSGLPLGDVVADTAALVDRTLELVDRQYPAFSTRVSST